MARSHDLKLAAMMVAAPFAAFYVALAIAGGSFGFDSHAYWLTGHGIHYGIPGERDAYLYTPAFAHAIRPLTMLPWHLFQLLWAAAAAATYVWLLRSLEWRWRIPLLAFCLTDVVVGNVWWIFALVLAYGFRRPVLWAIPLLTKMAPAVGIVWFAVRREWGKLAALATATAAIVGVSVVIDPAAWRAWLTFIEGGHSSQVVAVRMLGGAALAAYAAHTDRARLLPFAMILATPVLSPYVIPPVWAACFAMPHTRRDEARTAVTAPAREALDAI